MPDIVKQQRLHLLKFLLAGLFLLDIGHTFLQQYHAPLDGDLPAIVVPAPEYKTILNHPFGVKAIMQDTAYAGVNRYFVHQAMFQYFRIAPQCFQLWFSPIDSVYLTSGILKTCIHLILILLLAAYIRLSPQGDTWPFIIPILLVTPLFQSGGALFHIMGVVERSPTYASFYAAPLIPLLLFFSPAYLASQNALNRINQKLNLWQIVSLFALAIILPFSGPLISGIVLVISGASMVHKMLLNRSIHAPRIIKQWSNTFPPAYSLLLVLLNVLCLYSLYLGQYNAEHDQSVSIWTRYALLPSGLLHQLTNKLGPPLLLIMILINSLIIKYRIQSEQNKKIFQLLQWIGLFSLFYLLLLPLGGYREYRPLIIRRDTMLPIFILLFFFWGLSANYILSSLSGKKQLYYITFIVGCLMIFTLSDEPNYKANQCERMALTTIQQSSAPTVRIDKACHPLSWIPIASPGQSWLSSELLTIWGIAAPAQRYYQE